MVTAILVPVKHLVEMLLKKCGLDAVKAVMPEEHIKLLTNIRKINARKERHNAANTETGSFASKATTFRFALKTKKRKFIVAQKLSHVFLQQRESLSYIHIGMMRCNLLVQDMTCEAIPVLLIIMERLLLEMVSIVPDGVVCFFVSYSYMDAIVNTWNGTGTLKDIMQHKLVFFETQDVVETTLALDNYQRECDCGRGPLYLCCKWPYKILRAKLEYLRDAFQIQEGDFLTFDALRQPAQCVGRVICSKADYGMMIFVDKRCVCYLSRYGTGKGDRYWSC